MLLAAESIVGPYLWGVYDLVVMPPSFPYGGMENPCLTFVTPTLLVCQLSYVPSLLSIIVCFVQAGDRSLANVSFISDIYNFFKRFLLHCNVP